MVVLVSSIIDVDGGSGGATALQNLLAQRVQGQGRAQGRYMMRLQGECYSYICICTLSKMGCTCTPPELCVSIVVCLYMEMLHGNHEVLKKAI